MTVSAAMAAVILLAVGGWLATRALQHELSPSTDSVLAQLREVPHPAGAVVVGHRTIRRSYNSGPSAWLTYQVPTVACPALATFLTAGAREQGAQVANPAKSFCKPAGKGFESFCLPTVCFFADFMSDANPERYTISTGPDGEG